ncbi:MAG: glycosyl transferase family 2 [Deltaproteobacteria bacterium RIFCSPLOWO2_02_FULL_44_10]|nr:MAG: glycosyl transferase family 2 [Deltaproteobacteria bacterium RIFCSPHIGHO2_02_FULL_44_16]OGQ46382.1 MAG: glycosyl transferase family 2 [Deltaproteobacteria bacterium RIFCSPLOWO2_02_FULL_44_10]
MLLGKKIVVVMPAYNAEQTLKRTYEEIPIGFVDEILVVDDASTDRTVLSAENLSIPVFRHPANKGYGGNQKTCYRLALQKGADIIIMLHPDYQYSPQLIPAMAAMLVSGHYDVVLASRILGKGALHGGMPLYKYISNRFLTFAENILISQKLSEYHTGYRGYTRQVLETLPLGENSNDFVFDNQFLVQAHFFGFRLGEISCPTKYFPEASSINFRRSVQYGLGVLKTAFQYRFQRWKWKQFPLFDSHGKKL